MVLNGPTDTLTPLNAAIVAVQHQWPRGMTVSTAGTTARIIGSTAWAVPARPWPQALPARTLSTKFCAVPSWRSPRRSARGVRRGG